MTSNALILQTSWMSWCCYLWVVQTDVARQVSPVRTVILRRFRLSFSSCVQFKIIWLIVCSYFIPYRQVELGINLNLWRYDLFKPWPDSIAVNSAVICVMVFNLSFNYWKMNLLTVPFVEVAHCTFNFVISFSLPSIFIAPYNILPYTNSAMSSAAAFLVRRSAVSFPCIPTRAFTQLNNTVHFYSSRLSIFFITFPIIM